MDSFVEDVMKFSVKICNNKENHNGGKLFLSTVLYIVKANVEVNSHEGKLEQNTIN